MSVEARRAAAAKYRLERVRTLLVAEGPPNAEDRYFYFEHVSRYDGLFRYVAKGVLGRFPTRSEKQDALQQLKAQGVFLIDLSEEPVGDRNELVGSVGGLVQRCRDLSPSCIVLIKANVYDLCFAPLRAAGLPVVDERIPFPAAGQQRRFEIAFARALAGCR